MSRNEKPCHGRLPTFSPEIQALIGEERRRPPPLSGVSECVRARVTAALNGRIRKRQRPREPKE